MKGKIKKENNPDGSMSLSGHLKELRNRIIVILLVLVAGFVIFFSFGQPVIKLLTDMGEKACENYEFVALTPQESLMVCFTISLIGGCVLAFPVAAYEIYAFSSPGLEKKEKSFMLLSMIFGGVCFCIGVLFAYKIMLPFMLKFLFQFNESLNVKSSISIQNYINFILSIFVILGIVFEMPVIAVLLTSLGILKPSWLKKARKIIIILIFFVAAVITPPDIVSQIMVAVPMCLLNELSILLCGLVYKLKHKDDADSEEDID